MATEALSQFLATQRSHAGGLTGQLNAFGTALVAGGAYSQSHIELPGPSSRRTPIAITEIMYKPAPGADTNNLEYIEVYNSNPWFHDIGGLPVSTSFIQSGIIELHSGCHVAMSLPTPRHCRRPRYWSNEILPILARSFKKRDKKVALVFGNLLSDKVEKTATDYDPDHCREYVGSCGNGHRVSAARQRIIGQRCAPQPRLSPKPRGIWSCRLTRVRSTRWGAGAMSSWLCSTDAHVAIPRRLSNGTNATSPRRQCARWWPPWRRRHASRPSDLRAMNPTEQVPVEP